MLTGLTGRYVLQATRARGASRAAGLRATSSIRWCCWHTGGREAPMRFVAPLKCAHQRLAQEWGGACKLICKEERSLIFIKWHRGCAAIVRSRGQQIAAHLHLRNSMFVRTLITSLAFASSATAAFAQSSAAPNPATSPAAAVADANDCVPQRPRHDHGADRGMPTPQNKCVDAQKQNDARTKTSTAHDHGKVHKNQ